MKTALAHFQPLPLKDAARQLLAKLGYKSDKFLAGAGSSPQSFLDLFDSGHAFDPAKALVPEWKTADLLFQLTDQELSRETSLFTDTSVKAGLLKSYVFIAIELKGSDYARGKFSAISRQINRLFPMPVMVLFKHQNRLTIAVINRRRNKIEADKDVLEKATLIRDINFTQPHRGHLDILDSLALTNLVHPQKKPINDFDTLHAAWEQIFNVELLNERFYRELANWYFWALPQVEFPADLEPDDEKRRATGLIRLLTRLIFCWFLKEKDLIPEKLFHPTDLAEMLKGFDPESETSSTYYQAILQNLFFATLNQRMGNDSKGQPYRRYVTKEKYQGKNKEHGVTTLFRYPEHFTQSDTAVAHFADIPFLNGGLFECLDREDPNDKNRMLRLDGFTTDGKRPLVPDRLFFDNGETADLSTAYGDTKRKAEKITGLIHILNRYKFTIVENTPIDQEIALDPELLGKVFENLLASYNEETKTTARKQTGSFYTPRPIVDYMVDESLKAHLTRALVEKARMKESDARAGLDLIFAYTEKEHAFTPAEVATLIAAIDALKILDPACGSGAFPMGVLHKLVYILGKLDPDNDRWKHTQLAKLDSAPMREELERAFADNNDDYGRKLYLIENCLYGVDIQPIAIQITKLRFFISLVCDQKTNRNKQENHGIRPLPNLETKFVAADTLIGLPIPEPDLFITTLIAPIEKEIEDAYHGHFSIQRRDQKLALQKKIKVLRLKLADTIVNGLGAKQNADITQKARHVAEWDPFDPQSTADFFDPHWMFGQSLKDGFDIVIGNPPYLRIQGIQQTNPKAAEYYKEHYSAATGSFDLYVIFMERGMQLIGNNGILSFINPDKWVNASFGQGIRRFAIDHRNVHKLISFGAHQIFSACTYSSLLWMGRLPVSGLKYSRIAPEESKATSLEDELSKLEPSSFATIPFDSLSDEPWILAAGKSSAVISAIQIHQRTAGQIFAKMFQGIASSKDSVYFLKGAVDRGSIWEATSSELGGRIRIEKGLVRPLLMGDQVHRFEPIRTDNLVLFPYSLTQSDEEDSAELMSPNEIEGLFPYGWQYLLRCADVLKGRERGRLLGDERWYRYIYPKNQTLFRKPKLLAPYISLGGNFTLDCHGEYYTTTTLYGYIKHDAVWESYEFLLAVMNSKVLWFYLRTSGSVLANGYFRYKPAYLQNFPIPEVSKKAEAITSTLVKCLLAEKADGTLSGVAAFLEDLIEACVMECYFREHMAERDLLFHDIVAPHLAAYDPVASETQQRDFLTRLHATFNAPSHPIRNRLLRLTADSPDLLAVIKQEGRV
ncbi:MAG: Eco57I restriction-modification methylase domain-containing protein [Verrucomicrobiota bacterium]